MNCQEFWDHLPQRGHDITEAQTAHLAECAICAAQWAPHRALAAGLQARGFQRCALLGGSHVHSLFFEAGLVDEVWLTVEPVLFGGGTPLLARRADLRLELLAAEKLGAHALLLKYRVPR